MSTIAEFRGSFRSVIDDGARLRRGSKGTWYCRCGELADVEHGNPKCETCTSGRSCGLDCTISKISCHKCGATA